MAKITVAREPEYAPVGFLVCRVDEHGGYDSRSDDTILIDHDWDYPALAATWGYVPCSQCGTDGTVDCPHHTATEMITAAYDWLEAHTGEIADDPGYFDADV